MQPLKERQRFIPAPVIDEKELRLPWDSVDHICKTADCFLDDVFFVVAGDDDSNSYSILLAVILDSLEASRQLPDYLIADASRLIYNLIRESYNEAAGRFLLSGMLIAHQTFGDMLRWNSHFHAIVLEGGFDSEGTFFYIPFAGLQPMVEVFRRRVIKLLVERVLLKCRVYPKCGAEMKATAVIENPDEIRRILRHVVKIGRSPSGFNSDRLS